MNEEAGYQKDINKMLIKKVRDIEKLNETLEVTLAKKEDDIKVAETEVQRRIENKQGKVNNVCTKYAYEQEFKYGETCKFIYKRICKIYVKYGQCRSGQRWNYSHDFEGRCK